MYNVIHVYYILVMFKSLKLMVYILIYNRLYNSIVIKLNTNFI